MLALALLMALAFAATGFEINRDLRGRWWFGAAFMSLYAAFWAQAAVNHADDDRFAFAVCFILAVVLVPIRLAMAIGALWQRWATWRSV